MNKLLSIAAAIALSTASLSTMAGGGCAYGQHKLKSASTNDVTPVAAATAKNDPLADMVKIAATEKPQKDEVAKTQ